MTKPASLLFGLCAFWVSLAPLAHPGADAALAYFDEQIRAHPQDPALYLQRGTVYSNDGQYPQALADFERAASLGERILASFDLGILYYRRGEFDIARRYFDEYLQRFPENTACIEYRARLLRDAGELDAAVADYRRLFTLQARPNPGHFITVAEILSAGGDAGIEQALAILDEGNRKLGITPQLQYLASQLELRAGRPGMAVQRMSSLEPTLGKSARWKVDMVELMLQAGEREQAVDMLGAASRQLQKSRRTPAQLETLKRISSLRAALAETG
jgi:tetratricopeptide (TPR) repeat protein